MNIKLFVCGIDEAGRGPLAGPLSVGGVIFPPLADISNFIDSKKLKERDRETLFEDIKSKALVYSHTFVDPEEIDKLNILEATKTGMYRVALDIYQKINSLYPQSKNLIHFLVDGNKKFCTNLSQDSIIKGDGLIRLIGAASIIAKVIRDLEMVKINQTYPSYGFDVHKGYPTRMHKEMIQKLGVLPIHRKTFKGVKEYLNQGS